MIKNVIIAGVGGQGTIFAGKILGTMAYQTGLHVKYRKFMECPSGAAVS